MVRVVAIVSIELPALVLEMVTEGGFGEQVGADGVVPLGPVIEQARLTMPVKPPPGVKVTTLVVELPAVIVAMLVAEIARLAVAVEYTMTVLAEPA